jgi:hypothetical protein
MAAVCCGFGRIWFLLGLIFTTKDRKKGWRYKSFLGFSREGVSTRSLEFVYESWDSHLTYVKVQNFETGYADKWIYIYEVQ